MYREAVQVADLKPGGKAALIVLENAPTISCLLEDENVVSLGPLTYILDRLCTLIAFAAKRKDIAHELSSLLTWLRQVSSLPFEYDAACPSKIKNLIQTILNSRSASGKYACVTEAVKILTVMFTNGAEVEMLRRETTSVLNVIRLHVQQHCESSMHSMQVQELYAEFIHRWTHLLDAEEELEKISEELQGEGPSSLSPAAGVGSIRRTLQSASLIPPTRIRQLSSLWNSHCKSRDLLRSPQERTKEVCSCTMILEGSVMH